MTKDASREKPLRIALLYRYGVHDHAELYPIIPEVLRQLGQQCSVLYVGPNRRRAGAQYAFPGVRYLFLPFSVDRSTTFSKVTKALLWCVYLPFISFYLRFVWRADLAWIDESSLPCQGRLVQLLAGRPLAMTVTDFFLDIYSERIFWLRPLKRVLDVLDRQGWLRAAVIFTRTESLRQYLIGRGVSAGRVVVARDAVLQDLFIPGDGTAMRRKLGFTSDDVVVCHHGILHPNKGIPRIARWMIPAMKLDPHLKLLIVGGGPDLEILQEMINTNQMQNQIIITGWLASHAEVNAHLNAADIGLVMRIGQPTDHFHVTGALVHSMMCALPALACRLEGIQEIVTEGSEGLLFDPASGDEFLQKLAVMRNDPARRREMGQRGRAKALFEFNPERIALQTVRELIRFARLGLEHPGRIGK